MIPTLDDIKSAAARIEPYAHRTPVMTSRNINNITGAELYFKCENLQRAGAFKFRGACNAVFSLSEKEAAKGAATHSSGNFAQALALAAAIRGITAAIVMPRTAPQVKVNAVSGYGAEIIFCEPTLEARETTLQELVDRTGATFLHPYNNYTVIYGQGTAAIELLTDLNDLDIIMTPVGGGGLLSGTAIAAKSLKPGIKVFAAEPTGADDAYRSLQAVSIIPSVEPDTICDGLLTSLGDLTFPIIQKYVDEIITVSDEYTIKAMRLIFERMKLVVEPSAAIVLGAILEGKQDFSKKKIGIVLSGGNLDVDKFPR